ncbi:transcriptional regulator [Vibrio sp. HN007]|uniref:winged helix-turn-helix domain-containing protein n=1 Tax=Vibrio iocasae TaxID=3098914 RepID=UPI0035D50B8A
MTLIFEPSETLLIGNRFTFQPARHELIDCQEGKTIKLSEPGSRLLYFLASHSGQKLRKQRIIKYVWHDLGRIVQTSSLVQAIYELRKAFGEKGLKHPCIITVPNYGYVFTAKVELESDVVASTTAKDTYGNDRGDDLISDALVSDTLVSNAMASSVASSQYAPKLHSSIYAGIALMNKKVLLSMALVLVSVTITAFHHLSPMTLTSQSYNSNMQEIEAINGISVFTTESKISNTLFSNAERCVNQYMDKSNENFAKPYKLLITKNIFNKASLHIMFQPPYQHLNKSIRANNKNEFYENC